MPFHASAWLSRYLCAELIASRSASRLTALCIQYQVLPAIRSVAGDDGVWNSFARQAGEAAPWCLVPARAARLELALVVVGAAGPGELMPSSCFVGCVWRRLAGCGWSQPIRSHPRLRWRTYA